MNYIYDVILNFNNKLYDFYDWNKKDKIIHVKKIPSFKISDRDFINIKKNTIKISDDFIKKINSKTEEFKKTNITKLKYTSLFSNGKDVIAIKWNKNGISEQKSSLCIDEQEEIIDIVNRQKETPLKYKILKTEKKSNFKTRFETENQTTLNKELLNIYRQKDYKKMSYLHLECFGKKEKDIHIAFENLKKEIAKENDNFDKIYNFFKIINQK